MTRRFTQKARFSSEQTKVQLAEAIGKLQTLDIDGSVTNERLVRLRSSINELTKVYINIYREMLREEIRISNINIKAETISERKDILKTTYQNITSRLMT